MPTAAELVVARERSALSERPDICQQPTYLITASNNPCSRRWTIYATSGKSTVASNTARTGKQSDDGRALGGAGRRGGHVLSFTEVQC